MLVFEERGKPEYPEKNLLVQSRELTNSTHIIMTLRVWESNPGHIGGRPSSALTTALPAPSFNPLTPGSETNRLLLVNWRCLRVPEESMGYEILDSSTKLFEHHFFIQLLKISLTHSRLKQP